MARKFSIADICFYPKLFENKNKGTMPLEQFYFHSLEAHDSAFYTPRSLAGVIRNWSKISKLLIMSQKEVYILLIGNISMIYESKYKKFHIFDMQQAVGKLPCEQRLHFRGMSWRAKSSLCRQPFNFLSCMR